jgi:cytochrome c biogenesis protein CcmG/thiol:disulfide interchange protein DsbE
MNMKNGIILLLVGIGIAISPTLLLQARDSLPSAQRDCSSCPSFGVQRFEKRKAPPFSLKGLDGKKITLKDLNGKPVILTFWATWCSPCKEELPALEKFAVGKKGQLTIIAMAIDGENKKKVQLFVEGNKINLTVLLDEKEQTARMYRVRAVPTTFLIDREGMMLGAIIGQRDWSVPEAWSAIKELFDLH